MLKKYTKTAIAVVMVFVIALGFTIILNTFSPSQAIAEENSQAKSSISVNGSYAVKVSPDIAYITIGINTFAENPKEAQKENREQMDKVFDKLLALGIEEKDIQTTNYSITPKYEWKNIEEKGEDGRITHRSESVLIGYNVDNTIRITVRDLNLVGNVIDVTVEEGINKANSIAFGISDSIREEKYLEALKGAVEAAKEKAETIASVYNVELGSPFSIVEGSSYIPAPIYRDLGMVKDVAVAMDESVSTPISAGELEIRANVSVVYRY